MNWVEGIDVSRWQTPGPPPAGTRFGIIKASQGGSRDSKLATHHAAFTRAGLDRGAYCYYDFDSSPERNAETFLAATAGLPWDLPHALDAEDTPDVLTGGPSKRLPTLGQQAVAAELLRFLDLVEAGTGRTPIVYTGSFWWRANVGFDERFARYPLWLARYPNRNATTPPSGFGSTKPPAPWAEITIWQYTDSGGRLDRNVVPAHLYASLLTGSKPAKPPTTTTPGDLTMADAQDILDHLAKQDSRLERIEKGILIDEQTDQRADRDERDRDGSTRGYLFALAEALGHPVDQLRARAMELDKADGFKQA
ncbi:glycoside hydrolase family 25 protein [Aquihabitans sp. G128]|uniref:glycoside hydrolase family 25 protein n=1 Tax=Aquihabitans sp. G128 TaxID=2849779 RepID=UPI001C23D272|nr:glycoside hydrolase family 25 protein [Aquihabitans sp. G128]QXC59317.1 glycoside hydrolase family 25 protein [Aquihabitans sp. G128]